VHNPFLAGVTNFYNDYSRQPEASILVLKVQIQQSFENVNKNFHNFPKFDINKVLGLA